MKCFEMILKKAYLSLSVLLLPCPFGMGQNSVAPIPTLVHDHGRSTLLVDGSPYLLLGAQINNSSAFVASLPKVWPTLMELNVNTMEAPVYWETLETRPGKFDFDQVDTLIDQSRQHHVRLVLLWFGTWKNGSGHYIPEWMKLDEAKYPHVRRTDGTSVDSLSPHSAATLSADMRAFAALMKHLKEKDSQRTVIMVQVENEPGTWGAVRDHSAEAEKLFATNVPQPVLTAMHKHQGGSWTAVFGEDADGYFHSWAVAGYINAVAAAGKAEYPLPMYVNAALRDPLNPGRQGNWESGGATDDVLNIWKVAAPNIDLLAPDIYSPEYAKYLRVLELYHRPDNALLIPETGRSPAYARYCFAALGQGALGWAPFGMDQTSDYVDPAGTAGGASQLDDIAREQFAYNFAVLKPISRLIAKLEFEGNVRGAAESDVKGDRTERLSLGNWTAVVTYGRPHFGNAPASAIERPAVGEALVAKLGENDFLVAGYKARIDFEPAGESGKLKRQFLSVEEGTYLDGVWTRNIIWNGDQTDYGLNFATAPRLLRVRLATY